MAGLDGNIKNKKVKISSKRKDINFFSVKSVKKKRVDIVVPQWIYSLLIPSVAVAVIVAVYTYNQASIVRLHDELAASELEIEHANIDDRKPYYEKKTLQKDVFATYYSWVNDLNGQLNHLKTVPSQIVEDINKAGENLVTASQFTVAEDKILYIGSSNSLSSIADFQRNCNNISNVSDAFVSNINKQASSIGIVEQEDVFTFTLEAKFDSTKKDSNGILSWKSLDE